MVRRPDRSGPLRKPERSIIDDLKSTQTMDGAMKNLFGITYDDLDIYTGKDSSSRNDVPESVMKQIKAMFHH